MRKLLLMLFLAAFTTVGFAAEVKTEFKVTGMDCSACQAKIEKALQKTEGVKSAQVDWQRGQAVIVHDNEKVSPEQIKKIIAGAGFVAEKRK